LFNKKKQQAAAEAEKAQRAQVAALQAQLDEAKSERAALEERLAALGDTNDHFDRRLSALHEGVRSMGDQLVTLSSSSSETSRRVRSIDERLGESDIRVDGINHRLDQVEAIKSELDEINVRLASFATPPSPTDEPPPPPPAAARAQPAPVPPPPLTGAAASGDLDQRIAELRDQLDDLARQTSSIDARVTSVSMELANQLTELGSDIDELNRRASEPAAGDSATDIDTAALEARIAERLDAAMDDVLDSTERLAAEQARYEIQFRADLAELAERLRRPRT
jgi:chromosome segregation ATPase